MSVRPRNNLLVFANLLEAAILLIWPIMFKVQGVPFQVPGLKYQVQDHRLANRKGTKIVTLCVAWTINFVLILNYQCPTKNEKK